MNPAMTSRWGKAERRRMFVALLPLIIVSILAFLASR